METLEPVETGPLATAPPTESRPALTHRQVLVIFSGLMLGMALAAIDQTVVATALPTIVGDLGGLDHLSWVVTAYLLSETVSTPIYGKLGDLYGRKRIFQAAIVIFVVGSMLSGLAQSMLMLIICRAVQGLGGGGLMVTAQAMIADVVGPRERGRYQGYFGAVFATATVGGPLLGGFLTDRLSWRWVFYINLPLAIAALVVTSAVLKVPQRRTAHRIDWTGTGLLAVAISSVILGTTWGGNEFAWDSPVIVGLGVVALAAAIALIQVERRVAEPILRLPLFRIRTFVIAITVSFVVGVAMYGTTSYLPTFLQVANGVSASNSGLLIAPLMVGALTTSIAVGHFISRTGRYRIFPSIGMALVPTALFLFSRLTTSSSRIESGAYMVLLGVGIGLTMQVMVLATQNEAPPGDIGVATSSVMFFRAIGGAIGVAVFGALFTSRIGHYLGSGIDPSALSPADVAALPAAEHQHVATSFAKSITTVFRYAVPIGIVGWIATLFLREGRLHRTGAAERSGHDAAPAGPAGPRRAVAGVIEGPGRRRP